MREQEEGDRELQMHVQLELLFEVRSEDCVGKTFYRFITRESQMSWAAPSPGGFEATKGYLMQFFSLVLIVFVERGSH